MIVVQCLKSTIEKQLYLRFSPKETKESYTFVIIKSDYFEAKLRCQVILLGEPFAKTDY